jgi:hypothetical protein
MARNQKLTKVIAGRTVKAATVEPGGVLVVFDDQSKMKIKTVGPATIPPEGKVKSVHEAKTEFKIDFEDGSSATLCLADPGSSVPSEIRTMRWNTSDRSALAALGTGDGIDIPGIRFPCGLCRIATSATAS